MPRTTAVLFDIDGTLTDTNYLHVLAWRRAFLEVGEDVASARIHRMIGAGSEVLLRELVGQVRDDANDRWSEQFDRLVGEIRAFPAAGDLLRTIAARGPRVVLATSSPPDLVRSLTEAIDADDAIHAITSAGDVDEAKPEPDVFAKAMEEAGVGPSDAIVVGDSVWDVEAATRAGLRTVALRSGGISAAELGEAGAVAVFDDPADLLARLDESPLAPLFG